MFSHPDKNIEQFHIDPGMSVADLGSGAGFYSIPLAKAVGPSGRVYAVDVQKELLSKLQTDASAAGVHNIKLVWGDLDEKGGTKLPDRSVDRVVIANTLFQIEHKEVMLDEAYRVLKPGGKMLFVDWADSYGGLGPHPNEVIKPDVARVMLEEHKFEFDRDIQTGDHHYGFVVKKARI